MATLLLLRLSFCFILLLSYDDVAAVNSSTSTYPAVEAATAGDAVAVVSLDGTGSYKSIGAAIAAAPLRSPVRHVIHVKKGVYKEYISITGDMWNIALVGDGMDATIITGDRSAASGYNTWRAPRSVSDIVRDTPQYTYVRVATSYIQFLILHEL